MRKKLKQWKDKYGTIILNVLKIAWIVVIISFYIYGVWSNQKVLRKAKAADITAIVLCILIASGMIILTFCRPVLNGKRGHVAGNISLFVLPYISFCLVEWLFQNPFQMRIAVVVCNYFLYLAVYLAAFALTNRYRYAVILGNTLTFLAGLVNYFVLQFRGTPFCPWDIFSIETAASVAEGYTFTITLKLLCVILAVALINMWAFSLKEKIHNFMLRAGSAIAIIFAGGFMIYVMFLTSALESFGIKPNLFFQQVGYADNGYVLSFCMNIRYVQIEKPEAYSVKKVEEILEDVPKVEAVSQNAVNPNIIMIMNEAYADLSVVGEFETNIDYMEFVHGLTDNTITGDLYVSVYGGGTCNTEYEALTGNSMAFLPNGCIPYQQFITSAYKTGGIVSNLNEQGYRCMAIHPMGIGNWRRNVVYETMGFEWFWGIEHFVEPTYIRETLASDLDAYQKALDLLWEKEPGKSMFLFDVTVQNHGGYTYGGNFKKTVKVRGMKQDYPKVEEYLSLMKLSDEAFEYLIGELQQFEEPTLVVLFGDHQPALDDEFYEELIGKPMEEWNLEELQKRYQVPLIIWANYDIEEKDLGSLSANMLASVVYEYAGLKMPKYFEFQKKLAQTIPVLNVNGYMDKKGIMHEHSESSNSKYGALLGEYSILNYNSAIDHKYTVDELYADEQK